MPHKPLLNDFSWAFIPGTSTICAQYLRLPEFASLQLHLAFFSQTASGRNLVVVDPGTTKFLLRPFPVLAMTCLCEAGPWASFGPRLFEPATTAAAHS
jgi:hypothetical protein